MSKAVMISIRPEWCELIASGKKTIEVRKTKPKLETPFKCYIYCTKDNIDSSPKRVWWKSDKSGYRHIMNGKVIGEFVCDRIYQYSTANANGVDISDEDMEKKSCLTRKQLDEYEFSAEAKDFEVYNIGLYGWHISDLVIYDKPKELSEFYTSKHKHKSCRDCEYKGWKEMYSSKCDCEMCFEKAPITKPPQSWRYVEDLPDE